MSKIAKVFTTVILLLLFVSCNNRGPKGEDIPKHVLISLSENDSDVTSDGIFLTTEGWHKVETNIVRLQKEIALLRNE